MAEQCTLDGEVLYSFRINRHGSLQLAKWDGHKRPVEIYTITAGGAGKCDCMGSMRKPYCKHRQLVDDVVALATREDVTLVGSFYDYDRKILYTPSDGEGIPLTGVVTIVPRLER